jgi:hypothetical protein
MKRFIAILITVLYLAPSIGYSIDIQWCCNKISGISFSPVKTAKCNVCATPKHCCRHTHIVVKLKDNQHSSSTTKISVNTTVSPTLSHFVFPSSAICLAYYINYRPPPLIGDQPIYLTIGVFRV